MNLPASSAPDQAGGRLWDRITAPLGKRNALDRLALVMGLVRALHGHRLRHPRPGEGRWDVKHKGCIHVRPCEPYRGNFYAVDWFDARGKWKATSYGRDPGMTKKQAQARRKAALRREKDGGT